MCARALSLCTNMSTLYRNMYIEIHRATSICVSAESKGYFYMCDRYLQVDVYIVVHVCEGSICTCETHVRGLHVSAECTCTKATCEG